MADGCWYDFVDERREVLICGAHRDSHSRIHVFADPSRRAGSLADLLAQQKLRGVALAEAERAA